RTRGAPSPARSRGAARGATGRCRGLRRSAGSGRRTPLPPGSTPARRSACGAGRQTGSRARSSDAEPALLEGGLELACEDPDRLSPRDHLAVEGRDPPGIAWTVAAHRTDKPPVEVVAELRERVTCTAEIEHD